MPKISVVIITFNEEQNIERCLRSVRRVADEIIVVDSYSTDRTEEIARSFDVHFVQHPFEGHIQQKNYALSLATYPHVLSLDADEALSEELEGNILNIKENLSFDAYAFPRLTRFYGKWIYFGGWYPEWKIRLWNRQKGLWGGINPHDKVQMIKGASVCYIKSKLLHYYYDTKSAHIRQLNNFADIAASEYFRLGINSNILTAIYHAGWRFIKSYFVKAGFLDGKIGFILAYRYTYYTFQKYKKLYAFYKQKNVI